MTHWYAIRTKPHQEEMAKASLVHLGFEAFYPRLRREAVIRRKRTTVTGPLFPGYLFARFEPSTQWRAVNYARGVLGIVTFGETLAVVEEVVVDGIRRRLQDGYVHVPVRTYHRGELVTIENGPLKGLQTVFERAMSDRQRIVLLLNTLAYQARLVVPLEQVASA